jgi:hypothetical protein
VNVNEAHHCNANTVCIHNNVIYGIHFGEFSHFANTFWSPLKFSVIALAIHSKDHRIKTLFMPTITEQYNGIITAVSKGNF